MRFSLLLVACTLLSSALALPGGPKPGTNKRGKAPAGEPPAAQPGDLVLVNSQHYIDGKINGHGSSERKTHPAIVVHHEPDTHIVHVAPIGHEHPGDVPTMPGAALGIPDNNGVGYVAVGTPKQVLQSNIKPLGKPKKGSEPLPPRLEADHFNALQEQIAANAPHPPEPPVKEKGKKKQKEKRSLGRGRLEARRNPAWRRDLEARRNRDW